MYTKFEKLQCNKSRSKVFLTFISGIVLTTIFTLKDKYIIIFTLEVESA
jgi:hypothetical protein